MTRRPSRHVRGPASDQMPSRNAAAVAGVLGIAFFLAATELLSGAVTGAPSPLASGGRLLIDVAPQPAVEAAIRILGSRDKDVLTAALLVLAAAVGAGAGIAARRRRWVEPVTFVVLGLTQVVLSRHLATALLGATVLCASGSSIAGYGALIGLFRAARFEAAASGATPTVAADTRVVTWTRRRFLIASTVVAAVAVSAGAIGRIVLATTRAAAARAAVRLPKPARAAPPLAPDASLDIPGLTPIITAAADFYRVDTAIVVPGVDPAGWTLAISGLVDHPTELRFDDLLAMPLEEEIVTICCVSNEVGGPLLGTARWLGVPLRHLLDVVGARREATTVVGRSVDGFAAAFPLSLALDGRPALVAVGMNGDPLPLEHGFPARLVVAGLFGFTSAVKWLREIELATDASMGEGYWADRGWTAAAAVVTQSRIDVPAAYAGIAAGPTTVAGVAWSPGRGITVVELQVDDGAWLPCRLTVPLGRAVWRQWEATWDASPGRHLLRVRATDGSGARQVEASRSPYPAGATGLHTVAVRVG